MKIYYPKTIFFVSLVFIISGAFNDGISRFVLAVPFMLIAGFIAFKKFKNHLVVGFVTFLSIAAIWMNLNLEKSSIVYPILDQGTVTVNKNGFLKTYSDGSGMYSETDVEEFKCAGCGEVKFQKINQGDVYPVQGIKVEHPDFSNKITLVTSIGQFSEHDYLTNKNITLNKDVKNKMFSHVSSLMYFPLIVFYISHEIKSDVSAPIKVQDQ